MSTMINIDRTKKLNTFFKKLSEKEVNSNISNYIRGKFLITRVRKYQYHSEVDIKFIGSIFAKIGHPIQSKWLGGEIMAQNEVSKIKVNRFIRRTLFEDISKYALYFGIKLHDRNCIKKVFWV